MKPRIMTSIIGIILFIVTAIWLAILLFKYKHLAYYDWDLAFFTQACWQLLHGKQYVSLVGINYFGDHSYFITFFILPFFALWAHPLTLIILKLAFFVLSAFLLYRIFIRQLSLYASLALTLGYLFLPANIFTLLYDFNPESLAVVFIVLLWDAFDRRRWNLFWFSALALLLIKENFALVLIAFALYALVKSKNDKSIVKHAAGLFAVSSIVFAILILWVIPHFRHLDHHAFIVRYVYLGSSVGEMAANIIHHPSIVLERIWSFNSLHYLIELCGPWLILALIGCPVFLMVLPLLLQHLLSTHPPEHSIYYHYGMTLAPFIFLAVFQACVTLKKFVKGWCVDLCVVIIFMASVLNTFTYEKNFWGRVLPLSSNQEQSWSLINEIPANEGVIATFSFLAPLSLRENLYSFHKIYDSYYQDDRFIKHSELNTQQRFVLPSNVHYALIDYSDPWLVDSMEANPRLVQERIAVFLKNWVKIRQINSSVLYKKLPQ